MGLFTTDININIDTQPIASVDKIFADNVDGLEELGNIVECVIQDYYAPLEKVKIDLQNIKLETVDDVSKFQDLHSKVRSLDLNTLKKSIVEYIKTKPESELFKNFVIKYSKYIKLLTLSDIEDLLFMSKNNYKFISQRVLNYDGQYYTIENIDIDLIYDCKKIVAELRYGENSNYDILQDIELIHHYISSSTDKTYKLIDIEFLNSCNSCWWNIIFQDDAKVTEKIFKFYKKQYGEELLIISSHDKKEYHITHKSLISQTHNLMIRDNEKSTPAATIKQTTPIKEQSFWQLLKNKVKESLTK